MIKLVDPNVYASVKGLILTNCIEHDLPTGEAKILMSISCFSSTSQSQIAWYLFKIESATWECQGEILIMIIMIIVKSDSLMMASTFSTWSHIADLPISPRAFGKRTDRTRNRNFLNLQ